MPLFLCPTLSEFALFCAHLRSFALMCVFLQTTAFRRTAFGICRFYMRENGPLRHSAKWPIKEGKAPIKAVFRHPAMVEDGPSKKAHQEVYDISRMLGRTPEGSGTPRGQSRHLLENPLLRTLFRTLISLYSKAHSKPPLLRTLLKTPPPQPVTTLPRTSSEPFLEACVVARPLRLASKC